MKATASIHNEDVISLNIGTDPGAFRVFAFGSELDYIKNRKVTGIRYLLGGDELPATLQHNGATVDTLDATQSAALVLVLKNSRDEILLDHYPVAMLSNYFRTNSTPGALKNDVPFDLRHVDWNKSYLLTLAAISTTNDALVQFRVSFK